MQKTITAYDEVGNQFIKQVYLKKDILSFGWPVEYYVKTLMDGYPLTEDLCIDIMGQNHKRHPVFISKDDINQILEELTGEVS